MHIRARTDADLDALERIARTVQRLDGYPPHPPAELRRFVASPDALAAWVGVAGGEVRGHVALHRRSSDEVMALAVEATGEPIDRLAVVARLFVDPDFRRRGLATRLLEEATAAASAAGRRPVLDVATRFEAAIALYEKHGWTRAGEARVAFRGAELHELVLVGPITPAVTH